MAAAMVRSNPSTLRKRALSLGLGRFPPEGWLIEQEHEVSDINASGPPTRVGSSSPIQWQPEAVSIWEPSEGANQDTNQRTLAQDESPFLNLPERLASQKRVGLSPDEGRLPPKEK
jgi:hypothetical protein